jgi:hypothetical protein
LGFIRFLGGDNYSWEKLIEPSLIFLLNLPLLRLCRFFLNMLAVSSRAKAMEQTYGQLVPRIVYADAC